MGKVLVACEESQAVTIAFRQLGHEAYSCDILPCSGGHPEWHIQGNVREFFTWPHRHKLFKTYWDLVIAFPPCTYMSNSGVRWLYDKNGNKVLDRWEKLRMAIDLFTSFDWYMKKGMIGKLAKENPIPHRYARDGFKLGGNPYSKGIGKYDQIINPWQFGHGETKSTCLWLRELPELTPTKIVEGRDQRIWKLPPSPDRSKLRSKTFKGIAEAMAEQWGKLI